MSSTKRKATSPANKKKHAKTSAVDEALIQHLECPVCFEFCLRPPIYQCQDGHIVCMRCEPIINKCPTCQQTLTNPHRAITLENLVRALDLKCAPDEMAVTKPLPASPTQDQLHHVLQRLLGRLWRLDWGEPWGNPFHAVITPETCRSLGIPHYFKIVNTPMNLTWIKGKVEGKQYSSLQEFKADVTLMLNNALAYNKQGEAVYAYAQELQKTFERELAVQTGTLSSDTNGPQNQTRIAPSASGKRRNTEPVIDLT